MATHKYWDYVPAALINAVKLIEEGMGACKQFKCLETKVSLSSLRR